MKHDTTKNNTQIFVLPAQVPLLSRAGWAVFLFALLVVGVLAPVLNLLVPEGHVLHLSDYAVGLIGKIMCYAICALAIDLIWGLQRHSEFGPWPILCSWGLCDGYVSDAPNRC